MRVVATHVPGKMNYLVPRLPTASRWPLSEVAVQPAHCG